MKPSVNNLNSNQPKTLSKREDKKRVAISWNHGLYFQVGLVLSLLIVFFAMEMSIGYKSNKTNTYNTSVIEEPPMMIYDVFEEPKVEIPKNTLISKQIETSKPITDILTEVPNETKETETTTATTEVPIVDKPTTTKVEEPIVNKGPSNMNTVEFVPIFPGCESLATNSERRACLSSKISAFVQKKFRTDKFGSLGDKGKQKIYVQFKIDPAGNIVDVMARGPHSSLEKEATRVINMLPQMEPGRQGKIKVPVMYSLPIVFQLN